MCEFCNLNIKHEHGGNDFINNQSWAFFSSEAVEFACRVTSDSPPANANTSASASAKNNETSIAGKTAGNGSGGGDDGDEDGDGDGEQDDDGT